MSPVHTTGVNWDSVAAIGTFVLLVVGLFTKWLGNKIDESVKTLGARLDGKDAEQQRKLNNLRKRVRLLERNRK
jgi:hypothetical protein